MLSLLRNAKTPIVLAGILMLVFQAGSVLAFNYASTTITVKVSCGNNVVEGVEVCDGTDFAGQACHDFLDSKNNPFSQGELNCSNTCDRVYTTFCSNCGNGIKEGYEQCDGTDFGLTASGTPISCRNYGYNSGTLGCSGACNVSVMNCASVGLTEPGNAGSQGGGTVGGSGGGNPGGGNPGPANGFEPGSNTAPKDTKLVVIGKAYPGSEVNILIDGKEIGIVKANPKADFYFETSKITPGVIGMGLWAEDGKGRKSALQNFTFRVSSGAVTTISGAYLAPSIDIDKPVVARGEILKVSGVTVPESNVTIYVHSNTEVVKTSSSTPRGDWTYDFDTTPLEGDAYHVVKATFEAKSSSTGLIKSGFSKAVSFYVGKSPSNTGTCPGADLNKDKKVNLIDFSILLFYWGTNNTCADQNRNGKVDLIDFSIMLYNWTG
jgi:hypothetical protein